MKRLVLIILALCISASSQIVLWKTASGVTVVSISISPVNPSVSLTIGTESFSCTANMSDSSTHPCITPAWSSGNGTVASINSSGVATLIGPGSSIITVVAEGKTLTTTLTVTGSGSFSNLMPANDAADWQIDGSGTFGLHNGDPTSGTPTTGDIGFGNWGGAEYAGMRFVLATAIPAGSHITSAILVPYVQGGGTNHGFLYVTDSADAALVSAGTGRPTFESGGTTTVFPATAQTQASNTVMVLSSGWSFHTSPTINIAPLIQHLVDTYSGIASGAHIVVWIGGDPTDGGFTRTPIGDFTCNGSSLDTNCHAAQLSVAWN